MYSVHRCSRAGFPKLPQTIVALVPEAGPIGKDVDAVSAKAFGVLYTAIAGGQETFAVTPKTPPLGSANSNSTVQAGNSAVLVRDADSVAQTVPVRELEIQCSGRAP